MSFSVIYDANVLYGNTLRDLHIRIARAGLDAQLETAAARLARTILESGEPA